MAETLFTDAALQDAYRALMRDNTSGHLDEPTWERLAAGQIQDADRQALFDHIVACEQCATIWRGVSELRKEAEAQGLIAAERPAAAAIWTRPWVLAAVAAALVLAAGGVYLTRQPSIGTDTTLRGTATPPVEGLAMTVGADGVPTFAWTPIAAASRYRVDVFTEDGRPVWTRETGAPPLSWPSEIPHPPGAYRWRVEALDAAGVVARSRLLPIQIPVR